MIQLHHTSYSNFTLIFIFQAFPYHADVSISSLNPKYTEISLVFHLFPSIPSNNLSKWTLIVFFPLRQHQQPIKKKHILFTQIIKIVISYRMYRKSFSLNLSIKICWSGESHCLESILTFAVAHFTRDMGHVWAQSSPQHVTGAWYRELHRAVILHTGMRLQTGAVQRHQR